jgi:hypothetical protein
VQPREAAQINRKAINRLARDFRSAVFFHGAQKLSDPPPQGKHGDFAAVIYFGIRPGNHIMPNWAHKPVALGVFFGKAVCVREWLGS